MAETTDVDPDPLTLEELIKDELGRADAALGRTETKTSILLAVFSPILTLGLAPGDRGSDHVHHLDLTAGLTSPPAEAGGFHPHGVTFLLRSP